MASLWNLITLAVATSTLVIGSFVYVHHGPRGNKGDPGESFHIDVSQNLSDCDDFATVVDMFPGASISQPIMWLVEIDSRLAYTGCPTVYDLKEVDVTSSDLSGHLLVYNGSTWHDYGTFNGVTGVNGTDGRTTLSGVIAPTTEGTNGDFYINTATSTLYGPKTSGTWPSGASLIGPDGVDGTNGLNVFNAPGAPDNGTGIDGEYYIDTSAMTVYQKSAGTWGSGTPLKNSPVNAVPIFAVFTTTQVYESTGFHMMNFGTVSISQSTWTSASSTWTCNTTAKYEVNAIAEFKCNSWSTAFAPYIQILVNGGVVQTNILDFPSSVSTSRSTGTLHYIANFTAGDTLRIRLSPNGPAGTDEIQVTNSAFSIVRVAS
jgi:hypothetical protein